MKAKHIVHILVLLLTLGTVAFFVARPDAQTVEDPWETWIDEQTETVLKSAGEMDAARRAEMRATIREKFSALATELKDEITSPPQTQDYAILQTVKQLRNAYDEGYNRKHKDTSVRVSYKVGGGEIFAYDENIPIAEVDAKYPRDEWLEMLLDKGIMIDNFEEYWAYLSKRDELVALEKYPEVWSSGLFGIPAMDDWETYKAAYLKQMFEKLHENKKNAVYFGKVDAEEALKRSRALIERLEQSKPLLRDR